MKKNILVFGLLSGLIVSVAMSVSMVLCYNKNSYSGNMVLGYTMMLLAFVFVFVGIKNYRDKFNGGLISFGNAFKIGGLIALIASTMYVIAWLIVYYNFIPDFMEKYSAHVINQAKEAKVSQAELNKQIAQMNSFKEIYKSPLGIILMTYLEILPLGLIVALISSLILKRKEMKLAA
ncbi:DUF4199 domain-containing protein [Pedobacter sp. KR3-3]|uniref:DUF4199 domain-containing protein n=1 Tax=Pedobacter albus TaxID=3113905 RepID=A0ABU7I3U0_9SPHI|nr:DUF4199 domain-containing protein [Pedobacter sp. KR3-3]MEE1944120.1 DUF4199 domain-containing protein [Pedobacter sp. KR3-3]